MKRPKHLHRQAAMFPNGDDLPLFSSGCVIDRSEPYQPVAEPTEGDTMPMFCDEECNRPGCKDCDK